MANQKNQIIIDQLTKISDIKEFFKFFFKASFKI